MYVALAGEVVPAGQVDRELDGDAGERCGLAQQRPPDEQEIGHPVPAPSARHCRDAEDRHPLPRVRRPLS
jgi:hypothetical protein